MTTVQAAPRLPAPDPRDPEDRLAAVLRRRVDAAAGRARHLRRAGRAGHRRGLARRSRSAPTPPSWAAPWASTAAGTSSTPSTPRVRERVPVVGIWHSGGARLAEGVTALHAVGEVFAAMVRASGPGAADLGRARLRPPVAPPTARRSPTW